MKPIIAVTMGDPAGVGPEIILKAASHSNLWKMGIPVVLGDFALLSSLQSRLARKIGRQKVVLSKLDRDDASSKKIRSLAGRSLLVIDFKNVSRKTFRHGGAEARFGRAAGDYIRGAIDGAMSRTFDAVVTAPVNKVSFGLGQEKSKFIGHTEMFARLTGAEKVALMLVCGPMRSIHVTSHIALKNVARSITRQRVEDTIHLAQEGLIRLGIRRPKIAVCGLNPHAGDGGLMGREERQIIGPVIDRCRNKRIKVDGPLPADSVWPKVRAGIYDIGVAMYHDQGQIPVKLMSFRFSKNRKAETAGVNITVGLPIIRTSVDHGTAYDIAGQGLASERSLVQAFKLAVFMARLKSTARNAGPLS